MDNKASLLLGVGLLCAGSVACIGEDRPIQILSPIEAAVVDPGQILEIRAEIREDFVVERVDLQLRHEAFDVDAVLGAWSVGAEAFSFSESVTLPRDLIPGVGYRVNLWVWDRVGPRDADLVYVEIR